MRVLTALTETYVQIVIHPNTPEDIASIRTMLEFVDPLVRPPSNIHNLYDLAEIISRNAGSLNVLVDNNIVSTAAKFAAGEPISTSEGGASAERTTAALLAFLSLGNFQLEPNVALHEQAWRTTHNHAIDVLERFRIADNVDSAACVDIGLGRADRIGDTELSRVRSVLAGRGRASTQGDFRSVLQNWRVSYRSLLKLIEIERTSATAQSKATAFLDWMANEHFFALVPTVLGLIYLAPDRPGGLIKNSASADPSRVSAGLQNASWDCVYIKQWAIRVKASVGGELWFFASMDTLARLLSRFLFPQSGESSDEAILRVLGLYWRQPRAASLLVQHYAQFRGRQPRPDVVAERMANLDAGIRQTEALLGLPPARLEVA